MSENNKLQKLRSRRYLILAILLLSLAAGLVLLPKYKKNEGISPEQFVKNATSSERYISTDLLAEKLVNQDPTVLLIDTRTESEFTSFSLPNAIHMPLENMLQENFRDYLQQDVYDVVLFSNDNFYADQAWMLGNRLGYKKLYVLKGGLNAWFTTIINPPYPEETMAQEAFDLYSFRKGAGMYFGVGVSADDNAASTKPKKVFTIRKKKKKVAEGGC